MTKTAVSKLVAEALQTEGVGTVGTDIFYMALDDSTDAQVCVFDNPGFESPLPETYEQPTIQVVVRGAKDADAENAYNKAREVYEFLIQYPNDGEFTGFVPTGGVNALGRDDNARPQFTMNFFTYRNSLA